MLRKVETHRTNCATVEKPFNEETRNPGRISGIFSWFPGFLSNHQLMFFGSDEAPHVPHPVVELGRDAEGALQLQPLERNQTSKE